MRGMPGKKVLAGGWRVIPLTVCASSCIDALKKMYFPGHGCPGFLGMNRDSWFCDLRRGKTHVFKWNWFGAATCGAAQDTAFALAGAPADRFSDRYCHCALLLYLKCCLSLARCWRFQ